MVDWKKTLATQSLKLMSDPRVAKLMQDERFLKLMMAAMSAPSKVQSFTSEHKDTLIDTLGLATRDEVEDLRRTVRSLEEQVGALQEVLASLVGDLPPGALTDEQGDDEE